MTLLFLFSFELILLLCYSHMDRQNIIIQILVVEELL